MPLVVYRGNLQSFYVQRGSRYMYVYMLYFPRPPRSYLDKRISLHLNKGRKVVGTLRGYDQFMNIVLGDATEEKSGNDSIDIGMVVSFKLQ